jgi:hypothetical protein
MVGHIGSILRARAWLVLVVAFLVAGCSLAQQSTDDPSVSSELRQAETLVAAGRAADAVLLLQGLPPSADAQIIRWAEPRADRLHALVLFELARRQLSSNPEAGLKWAYVGRIWAGYDGGRCKKPSETEPAGWLMAGMLKEITLYEGEHRDTASAALKAAIEWEAQHPSPDSPAWVCNFGRNMDSTEDRIKDRAEWPRILDETRRAFDRSLRGRLGLPPAIYKAPRILADPENPSSFRIIDAGLSTISWSMMSPDKQKSIQWLDDSRVLFVRQEPGHYASREEFDKTARENRWTYALVVWTVGGAAPTAIHNGAATFCYSLVDHYLSYETVRSNNVSRGLEGTLGQMVPYEQTFGLNSPRYRDGRTCRWVERSASQPARGHPDLLPGHGIVRWLSPPRGTMQLERPGSATPVPLPFEGAGLKSGGFYPFKQAYFVWDGRSAQQGDGRGPMVDYEERYQQTGCKRAWWLWLDGRTEEVCIPYIPGARTDDVQAVPTIKGLFITSRRTAGSTKTGLAGGYLVTPEGLIKIFSGVVGPDTLVTSPDGCKVAMSFAPSDAASRDVGSGPRTLRIVDLCSP